MIKETRCWKRSGNWEWEREGKELELEVECLGSGNSMVVAIRSQCPSGSEYGRSVSSQNPERGIVNS